METKSPQCSSTVSVRRNPYRRARATPLTNSSRLPFQSTSELPQISSFPIQDIISEQILQNSPTITAASPSPSQDSIVENLNVYLRIRPLVPLQGSKTNVEDRYARSRAKNVWPHNLSKKNNVKEKKNLKKKSNESCITVSEDFRSVTLSPPLPLQETKRIKSEIYEGFSYVFSAESTQSEVYEKMVNPLVEDFLGGKSGMLVALGPTGSGKTHTVFGSPREPGMVPLTLKRIFKSAQGTSRRFYLSIFEICSERGKAERIYDLTSDRAELSMQQQAIKGLQEILIHDVAEAELLIARALLKRSTAMTNANSQSSRSQCIINIWRGNNRSDVETDEQSNSVVLSIVDLAGAEREKRTGNQGARLAESNFINNTSMVFGLCLRSLLEHQKNPKKALQKHFQNSLLTRYLRDYLEGKKRMTLVLTVKSGEEDYLDASYLLRQASPYTKIKFTNIEAQPNLICNKRQFQTTSRSDQSKRMKLGNSDASVIERKIVGDENQCSDAGDLTSCNADLKSSRPLNLNSDDLMKKERTHQIMQSFAKALWNVLKQHNEKLKVAESENQILRENLRNEKKRSIEMEKELKNLRSCCACSKENSLVSTVVKVGENSESMVQSEGQTSCGIDETKLDLDSSNHIKSECSSSPRIFDSTPKEDQVLALRNEKCSPEKGNPFRRQKQDMCSEVLSQNIPSNLSGLECIDDKQEHKAMVRSSEADASSPSICVSNYNCQSCQVRSPEDASSPSICVSNDDNCQSCQIHETFPGTGNIHEDSGEADYIQAIDDKQEHEAMVSCSEDASSTSICASNDDNCQSCQIHESFPGTGNIHEDSSESNYIHAIDDKQEHEAMVRSSEVDASSPSICVSNDDNCQSCHVQIEESFPGTGNILEHSISNSGNDSTTSVQPGQQPGENNEVEQTQQRNLIDVPDSGIRLNTSCNSLKKEKPKRRLLPASSILVREISTYDADELDKPKGNGIGKNLTVSEGQRTQGSISLLRLLKSNLHSLV